MKNVFVGTLLQLNEETCDYDKTNIIVDKQQDQESKIAALQKQHVSNLINDSEEWAKLRSELKEKNLVTSSAIKQAMLKSALRKNEIKKKNNKNRDDNNDQEDNDDPNTNSNSGGDRRQHGTENIRRRLSLNKVDESFKKSLRSLMSGLGDSTNSLGETWTNNNDNNINNSSHYHKEEVLSRRKSLPLKKQKNKLAMTTKKTNDKDTKKNKVDINKDILSSQVTVDNRLACEEKRHSSLLINSFDRMLNLESLSSECLSSD